MSVESMEAHGAFEPGEEGLHIGPLHRALTYLDEWLSSLSPLTEVLISSTLSGHTICVELNNGEFGVTPKQAIDELDAHLIGGYHPDDPCRLSRHGASMTMVIKPERHE